MFHANDRLYQHTRLLRGAKTAQGELNAALKPLFPHTPNVHLMHDVLIVAAKTFYEHNLALQEVRKAIDKANLTLNPKKCSFEKRNLHFGECFSLQAAQDQIPKRLRLCKTSLHLKTEVN